MTPESHGLVFALAFVALLLAALGALLLSKGAREDSEASSFALTDGRIRIGDGANVLRFRLEAQPSGRTAFRAETRPNRAQAFVPPTERPEAAGFGADEDFRLEQVTGSPDDLDRLDPLTQTPVALGDEEFRQPLAFITNGLLDPKARPENLRKRTPARLPGGRPVHSFQQ